MDFEALFAKRSMHIKPGLLRMERSYHFLGQPAKAIPAVLIAGTNGKGSTSGFLWHLLALNSIQVGLYSSPHLVAFSERCQLSKHSCSEEEMAQGLDHLLQQLPSELYAELSFFEIATILAFQMFQTKNAEAQVLEVGLGGAWDATNVSDPLLAAVISLSLDHQNFLGNDLLTILNEKLGVMRKGRPLFWGNSGEICQVPGYLRHIQQKADDWHCPLFIAERDFAYDGDRHLIWLGMTGLSECELPIQGFMQLMPLFLLKNLAIATAMYHYLVEKNLISNLRPLREIWALFGQGPAPVTLYGRSQRLKVPSQAGDCKLLLDVCHNPNGAEAFLAGLLQQNLATPMPALICVLQDKDMNGILDRLRSRLHPVILFAIDHERSWHSDLLADRHKDLAFCANFDLAWQMAVANWKPALGPWAICGSVLAVGQVLQYFSCAPENGMSLERILSGDW